MASNLTSQVRSMASVTTAVAEGDLSKTDVESQGEVLGLGDAVDSVVSQVRSPFLRVLMHL
jgi:osomolarity two-component system sensor histidine kinase NIK1